MWFFFDQPAFGKSPSNAMAQPPSMTPLATAGAVVERLTSLERHLGVSKTNSSNYRVIQSDEALSPSIGGQQQPLTG